MSLIKIAFQQLQQQQPSEGFIQKHPLITASIGLTAGIAAADAGVGIYRNKLNNLPWKHELKQNLKEGALYGGILSGVEPLITHGIMGQREKKQ
jgi:hypothetical protein